MEEAARAALPAARVRAMHACGLQQFAPPADAAYAAVWVQWVLNYVTDVDLVGFLRRAAAALCSGTVGLLAPVGGAAEEAEPHIRSKLQAGKGVHRLSAASDLLFLTPTRRAAPPRRLDRAAGAA